jgi:hypothetical protein
MGKRSKKVNMVQKMCTHVCKCRMIPVETVPGIRRKGIKESSGVGEFK